MFNNETYSLTLAQGMEAASFLCLQDILIYNTQTDIKRYSGQPGPVPIVIGMGCAESAIIRSTNPAITKTNVNHVSFGGFFD